MEVMQCLINIKETSDQTKTAEMPIKSVHVLNSAKLETSTFMKNLCFFISQRDSFKTGLIYLDCKNFTSSVALLDTLFEVM
jgi:hypothetical protein